VETDPTEAVEEAEPYFPPTDPVVRIDQSGETQIAGGFGGGELPGGHAHAVIEDASSAGHRAPSRDRRRRV